MDRAIAKGYKYVNWDSAFKEAVRKKLGGAMSEVLQPIRDEDIRDLSPSQLAERLSQFESMRLTQMSDAKDQLWSEMAEHGKNSGVPMPWGSMQDRWGWRSGEVTLVAGPNNSAKSALVSQMALHYYGSTLLA